MTTYTTSIHGHRRPRLRRSIGGVAAAAVLAVPFAGAPAASAQTANNPLGGIENTLGDTIKGLPNTLAHPLGGSSGDGPPGGDACVDAVLISPLHQLRDRLHRPPARRPIHAGRDDEGDLQEPGALHAQADAHAAEALSSRRPGAPGAGGLESPLSLARRAIVVVVTTASASLRPQRRVEAAHR